MIRATAPVGPTSAKWQPFRIEFAVSPNKFMESSGIDELEPGEVHEAQAGLLGGLRGKDFRQRLGGDVRLSDQAHHDGGTRFVVFHADG